MCGLIEHRFNGFDGFARVFSLPGSDDSHRSWNLVLVSKEISGRNLILGTYKMRYLKPNDTVL